MILLHSFSWRFTIRAIAAFTLLLSIVWLFSSPGFEPLLAFLGGITLFLTSFAANGISDQKYIRAEGKLLSSENLFVWNSWSRDILGLPDDALPETPLYIRRPDVENEVRDALAQHRIISVEGLSGIGKTYLVSRVVREFAKTNSENNRILYFESQPEIAILRSLLLEAAQKAVY